MQTYKELAKNQNLDIFWEEATNKIHELKQKIFTESDKISYTNSLQNLLPLLHFFTYLLTYYRF
jgi:hypothetical protein